MLERIDAVAARLEAGDAERGTRQFMETVAFGEGAWASIPPEVRPMLVGKAPPLVIEARDPVTDTIDVTALAACPRPILLTEGDQSPACFPPVVAAFAEAADATGPG